jgi:hypothetical protein
MLFFMCSIRFQKIRNIVDNVFFSCVYSLFYTLCGLNKLEIKKKKLFSGQAVRDLAPILLKFRSFFFKISLIFVCVHVEGFLQAKT